MFVVLYIWLWVLDVLVSHILHARLNLPYICDIRRAISFFAYLCRKLQKHYIILGKLGMWSMEVDSTQCYLCLRDKNRHELSILKKNNVHISYMSICWIYSKRVHTLVTILYVNIVGKIMYFKTFTLSWQYFFWLWSER